MLLLEELGERAAVSLSISGYRGRYYAVLFGSLRQRPVVVVVIGQSKSRCTDCVRNFALIKIGYCGDGPWGEQQSAFMRLLPKLCGQIIPVAARKLREQKQLPERLLCFRL
jgi:hypothetical protein